LQRGKSGTHLEHEGIWGKPRGNQETSVRNRKRPGFAEGGGIGKGGISEKKKKGGRKIEIAKS